MLVKEGKKTIIFNEELLESGSVYRGDTGTDSSVWVCFHGRGDVWF